MLPGSSCGCTSLVTVAREAETVARMIMWLRANMADTATLDYIEPAAVRLRNWTIDCDSIVLSTSNRLYQTFAPKNQYAYFRRQLSRRCRRCSACVSSGVTRCVPSCVSPGRPSSKCGAVSSMSFVLTRLRSMCRSAIAGS